MNRRTGRYRTAVILVVAHVLAFTLVIFTKPHTPLAADGDLCVPMGDSCLEGSPGFYVAGRYFHTELDFRLLSLVDSPAIILADGAASIIKSAGLRTSRVAESYWLAGAWLGLGSVQWGLFGILLQARRLRPRRPSTEPVHAMRFAAKHAVAAAVVVGSISAFAAATYFALLVWAVLVGSGVGGPLAFPFMVLLAGFASAMTVAIVLLPVTALTEWVCLTRQIRLLWQIPIATTVMSMWLLILAVIAATVRSAPVAPMAFAAVVAFFLLLIPLGMYWWSMQSADWIFGFATACLGRMRGNCR